MFLLLDLFGVCQVEFKAFSGRNFVVLTNKTIKTYFDAIIAKLNVKNS